MKGFLVSLCVAFLGGSVTEAISNGYDVTNKEDVPYFAAIIKDGHIGCGGSIVSHYWVLTAAHCVVDSNGQADPKLFRVRTNAIKRSKGGNRYNVEKIVVNPYYNFKKIVDPNDVALLKVSRSIDFKPTQNRITLACDDVGATPGTKVTVSGFGKSINDVITADLIIVPYEGKFQVRLQAWASPENMKQIQVSVYRDDVRKQEGYIKTWSGGYSACDGDSGGPVVYEDRSGRKVLVGVVSTGPQICERPAIPNGNVAIKSQWWFIKLTTQNTPGDIEIENYCPGNDSPAWLGQEKYSNVNLS